MDQTEELVARIKALAAKQGVSPATLSTKLFGGGRRLTELENGGALTLPTYYRVLAAVEALERGEAA